MTIIASVSLSSPRARFIVLGVFLFAAFFLGGSARSDAQFLVGLRPLAAFALAYAATLLTREQWVQFKPLFLLLLCLAGLMAIQLVPLPFSIWSNLPQREPILAISEALGANDVWRPISLSPTRTWNSLFSLIVPAAALTLFAIQTDEHRKQAWLVVLAIVGLSAVFGVLQNLGGDRSAFYLHSFTSRGFATGFFSNRNHFGVLVALALLIAFWLIASLKSNDRNAIKMLVAAIGAIIVFVPMVFLSGSRAGLVCLVLALLIGAYMLARAPIVPEKLRVNRKISLTRKQLLMIAAGLFAGLCLIVVVSSRALALDRLLGEDDLVSLRWNLIPTLQQMMSDFALSGSGFGSFEFVYRVYEEDAMVSPKYLNNAHNDWAQFVIEGGIAAVVIALAFAALLITWVKSALNGPNSELARRKIMAIGCILLLAVASLVDYPVRTPAIMALFALCCATAALPQLVWQGRGKKD
ncbi:MAG: O-antigen ligase family protein [Erythrobacter sp.]